MSKPPQIDRKGLKGPDEFQKTGTNLLGAVAQHPHALKVLLGFFVVVVGGYYGFQEYQERSLEKGWKAYYEAKKKPEAERWDAYKKMASSGVTHRAEFFAAVELADHFYDQVKNAKADENKSSEAAQATEWYGKALGFSGLLPMEKQLLLFNRASSLEIEKKYDEALKEFTLAANSSGELKGLAVIGQGRVWELKGDIAKATELYNKVAIDFPNAEAGKLAKNSIRRLKSPILSQEKL